MPAVFAIALFSVLVPVKQWYAPAQPLEIQVKAPGVKLVLTDFTGKPLDAEGPADIAAEMTVDIKKLYATPLKTGGSYVLWAVPKGKELDQFIGTPLVINVREDHRRTAPPGPMVTKVEPLCYAVMTTDQGELTMVFFYDDAPLTSENFLKLAAQGFYDGLTFHRIVPGFVIQGGDPRNDGTGGPGYHVQAEFNDRKHEPGVLSMARTGDPHEGPGIMPRPEFADSAGSQFFVCLDYEKTQALDRKYTAFGKVVAGMNAVRAIAATPLADERSGKPQTPPVIKKVDVRPVTAKENPYKEIMGNFPGATPATKP